MTEATEPRSVKKLMLVSDVDDTSLEYVNALLIPEDMPEDTANEILEAVMTVVTKESDWSWKDALPLLAEKGITDMPFTIARSSY